MNEFTNNEKTKILDFYNKLSEVPDTAEATIARFMVGISRGCDLPGQDDIFQMGNKLYNCWVHNQSGLSQDDAIDAFNDLFCVGYPDFVYSNDGQYYDQELSPEQCQDILFHSSQDCFDFLVALKAFDSTPDMDFFKDDLTELLNFVKDPDRKNSLELQIQGAEERKAAPSSSMEKSVEHEPR